jgi:hypothetical protein
LYPADRRAADAVLAQPTLFADDLNAFTKLGNERSRRECGMRVFLALLISLFPFQTVRAQQIGDFINMGEKAYGFHGNLSGNIRTFQSEQGAVDIVANIMSSIGLPLRFEIYAAAVPNAQAVFNEGKRIILYNVVFMEEIKQKTGEYWSLMSIMAHEIGHHLSFHLTDSIENHKAELEADYFSGFVLGKLGASLKQSTAAMEALSSPLPTQSHPGRDDRVQAIALGWKAAVGNRRPNPDDIGKIDPAPPPASDGHNGGGSRSPSACGWYAIHYCSRDREVADDQSAEFGGHTIDTSDPAYPNFADGWYCSVTGPTEKSRANAIAVGAKRRGFPTAYIKNSC